MIGTRLSVPADRLRHAAQEAAGRRVHNTSEVRAAFPHRRESVALDRNVFQQSGDEESQLLNTSPHVAAAEWRGSKHQGIRRNTAREMNGIQPVQGRRRTTTREGGRKDLHPTQHLFVAGTTTDETMSRICGDQLKGRGIPVVAGKADTVVHFRLGMTLKNSTTDRL